MKRLGALAGLFTLWLAQPAAGDTLILRRGSGNAPIAPETPRTTVRCIILEESATSYKVQRAEGTVTYPADRVIRVVHDSIDANVALDQEFEEARLQRQAAARERRRKRLEWEASPEGKAELARRARARQAELREIEIFNQQARRSSGSRATSRRGTTARTPARRQCVRARG